MDWREEAKSRLISAFPGIAIVDRIGFHSRGGIFRRYRISRYGDCQGHNIRYCINEDIKVHSKLQLRKLEPVEVCIDFDDDEIVEVIFRFDGKIVD